MDPDPERRALLAASIAAGAAGAAGEPSPPLSRAPSPAAATFNIGAAWGAITSGIFRRRRSESGRAATPGPAHTPARGPAAGAAKLGAAAPQPLSSVTPTAATRSWGWGGIGSGDRVAHPVAAALPASPKQAHGWLVPSAGSQQQQQPQQLLGSRINLGQPSTQYVQQRQHQHHQHAAPSAKVLHPGVACTLQQQHARAHTATQPGLAVSEQRRLAEQLAAQRAAELAAEAPAQLQHPPHAELRAPTMVDDDDTRSTAAGGWLPPRAFVAAAAGAVAASTRAGAVSGGGTAAAHATGLAPAPLAGAPVEGLCLTGGPASRVLHSALDPAELPEACDSGGGGLGAVRLRPLLAGPAPVQRDAPATSDPLLGRRLAADARLGWRTLLQHQQRQHQANRTAAVPEGSFCEHVPLLAALPAPRALGSTMSAGAHVLVHAGVFNADPAPAVAAAHSTPGAVYHAAANPTARLVLGGARWAAAPVTLLPASASLPRALGGTPVPVNGAPLVVADGAAEPHPPHFSPAHKLGPEPQRELQVQQGPLQAQQAQQQQQQQQQQQPAWSLAAAAAPMQGFQELSVVRCQTEAQMQSPAVPSHSPPPSSHGALRDGCVPPAVQPAPPGTLAQQHAAAAGTHSAGGPAATAGASASFNDGVVPPTASPEIIPYTASLELSLPPGSSPAALQNSASLSEQQQQQPLPRQQQWQQEQLQLRTGTPAARQLRPKAMLQVHDSGGSGGGCGSRGGEAVSWGQAAEDPSAVKVGWQGTDWPAWPEGQREPMGKERGQQQRQLQPRQPHKQQGQDSGQQGGQDWRGSEERLPVWQEEQGRDLKPDEAERKGEAPGQADAQEHWSLQTVAAVPAPAPRTPAAPPSSAEPAGSTASVSPQLAAGGKSGTRDACAAADVGGLPNGGTAVAAAEGAALLLGAGPAATAKPSESAPVPRAGGRRHTDGTMPLLGSASPDGGDGGRNGGESGDGAREEMPHGGGEAGSGGAANHAASAEALGGGGYHGGSGGHSPLAAGAGAATAADGSSLRRRPALGKRARTEMELEVLQGWRNPDATARRMQMLSTLRGGGGVVAALEAWGARRGGEGGERRLLPCAARALAYLVALAAFHSGDHSGRAALFGG